MLKNGDILNSKSIQFFEKLSPAAQTFFMSQLRHQGKRRKQLRWGSAEKSLFLALYKTSPKAYRFLRKIFCLPSSRTLQRALQSLDIGPGINVSIVNHMATVSSKMKQNKRLCSLVFDEVTLMPNLSIYKNLNKVQGVEDFGFNRTKKIADHALVFMLRGINSNWKQPVAYFFVKTGVKTYLLKRLIKYVINIVHTKTSFKIVSTICDQGGTNRAAIASLCKDSGTLDDFTFSIGDDKFFPLFDPPHLLKCMRNNFVNKSVHFNGKVAKWQDIIDLYNFDGQANPDGKICPKLTDDHIYPEGRKKMKVKLATQVFSRSVYAGLIFAINANVLSAEAEGTADLVIFFNKLFDSLNGVHNSNKPLGGPLTATSRHFQFWGEAKPFLDRLKFFQNGSLTQPPPSVKNYIRTIRNVQSLFKYLQTVGVKYLCTRTLNQDCLENMFGVIRGLSGQNSRPTTVQFASAFKTCLVNNLISNSNSTNCEDDGTHFITGLLDSFTSTSDNDSSSEIFHCDDPPCMSTNLEIMLKTQFVSANKLFRTNTSSYITGFICKRVVKKDCPNCTSYFFTNETTDIHCLIHLKDYSGTSLFYPSISIINVVNDTKKIVFEKFFDVMEKNNLSRELLNYVHLNITCCATHDDNNNKSIGQCIVHIMIKYILYQINRKLKLKDSRENSLLDNYIRMHAPKIYK